MKVLIDGKEVEAKTDAKVIWKTPVRLDEETVVEGGET